MEINLLTEDNLPYYHLALWRTFGEEEAWGEWVRRWTAEEGRHAIVIRDYLTVTRGCDPKVLEQGRMDQALRGWYPEFAEQGPLDGVVFTTLQELATRISHRNTGAITEDETAIKLCSRVATDENLHYVFYRDMAVQAIEMNPSAMVEAMHRQITNFAMPGAGIPGFREKAKAMAQAGIYNLRIHLDQVLRPVLEKHWRLGDIEGLTDEAKQKREDIYAHLARLDRVAAQARRAARPGARRHVRRSARPGLSRADRVSWSRCRRWSWSPTTVMPTSCFTFEMTAETSSHPDPSKSVSLKDRIGRRGPTDAVTVTALPVRQAMLT